MGRSRRRARKAAASGGLPAASGRPETVGRAPAGSGGGTATGGTERRRRIDDPEWRRAERRRVARLNRLPDPVRSWADRSRWHAAAAAVLQMTLVIIVTMIGLRLVVGDWLPPYAAIVALALAVATQAGCRAINIRADRRAAGR